MASLEDDLYPLAHLEVDVDRATRAVAIVGERAGGSPSADFFAGRDPALARALR